MTSPPPPKHPKVSCIQWHMEEILEFFSLCLLDLGKLAKLRKTGRAQINRDRRRDLYQIEWIGKK